jgi:hypothetical protein
MNNDELYDFLMPFLEKAYKIGFISANIDTIIHAGGKPTETIDEYELTELCEKLVKELSK